MDVFFPKYLVALMRKEGRGRLKGKTKMNSSIVITHPSIHHLTYSLRLLSLVFLLIINISSNAENSNKT